MIVHAWLRRVREMFPKRVAEVLAGEVAREIPPEVLLSDEELVDAVPASVELVERILRHASALDGQSKRRAKALVRRVVSALELKWSKSVQLLRGSLRRDLRSPVQVARNLDFKRTIRENLQSYDPGLGTIVPRRVRFSQREFREKPWDVVVLVDQSGSMGPSVLHAAVMASIWAKIPALKVHLVAFDTRVVDLTGRVGDPVEALFGLQLGGGTNIGRAVAYAQQLVRRPEKTVVVLLSDLYEGGDPSALKVRVSDLVDSGVKVIVLLALDYASRPAHDREMAAWFASRGCRVASCTPEALVGLVRKLVEERVVR